MAVESTTLRTVMGRFTTGVAVVASMRDGEPVAMTANALASVSLDPPLVLFCPDKESKTLRGILDAGVFAINVLHDGQEDLARRFAASGPKDFDGVAWRPAHTGAPILKDCLAWLDCSIWAQHDGGDHLILVGLVKAAEINADRPPLVFYRSGYHTIAP